MRPRKTAAGSRGGGYLCRVLDAAVVGRKNSLFCDTVAGAHASARLNLLIECAKANGLEPYACNPSVPR